MKPKANLEKLGELILYIAKRCQDDPTFGATKLNKILFLADCFAYRSRLKTVTEGVVYQKLDRGPAPRCLLPAQKPLIKKRRLAIQEISYYGHTQKKPIALQDPDLCGFTGQDIAFVEAAIEAVAAKNATQVSNLSDEFIGWQLAEFGEDIPIELALLMDVEEPIEREMQIAQKLFKAK